MKKLNLIHKRWMCRLFALMLPLFFAIPGQASGDRARLWRISLPSDPARTPVYILGISHQGFDDEYDEYFFKKVLPAFDTSVEFWAEYADLKKFQNVECTTRLADNSQNRNLTRAARKLVGDRYENYFNTRIKNWSDVGDAKAQAMVRSAHAMMGPAYAAGLSEYGLLTSIGDYPTEPVTLNARPKVVAFLSRRRPAMVFHSIDEDKDVFDAYCGSGKDRSVLLQIQMDSAINPEDVQRRQRQRDADEFRRSLEDRVFARSEVELSVQGARSWLCNRNEKWLGIIKNAVGQGPSFFALGLAHLMPAAAKNVPCDDLLTALRREGMSVELIK
jgi:hypothetical protein